VTRFCSDTWTPRPGTLAWKALDRLSVRSETRTSLHRLIGGDMSGALRELSRAGLIESRGYGAGSRGWVVTPAGRAVLSGVPRADAHAVAPPEPERLPQREPVRVDGRWLLGCGIHTGLRARTRCAVCDAAHAATLAALDDGAIERHQRMTARTTLAMTRRQEAHGTTAGAQVPGYRPPQAATAERKAS
jgi:hypothetical protein